MQFDTTSDTSTYWNKWTNYPQSKTFAIGYFPVFTNPQKQGIDPKLYDLMKDVYIANYLEDWNAEGVNDDLRNILYSSKGFADIGYVPYGYVQGPYSLQKQSWYNGPSVDEMTAKYKEARNAAFQYMASISFQSDYEAWRAYNNSRGGGGFAGIVSGFLSNPINIINPAQALNFAVVQSTTGLTPEQQLAIGATVGAGVLAAGALGVGGAAAGSTEAAGATLDLGIPGVPSVALPSAGAAVAALEDKAKDEANNYINSILNPTPQRQQPTPEVMDTVSAPTTQKTSPLFWIGLVGVGLFAFI